MNDAKFSKRANTIRYMAACIKNSQPPDLILGIVGALEYLVARIERRLAQILERSAK